MSKEAVVQMLNRVEAESGLRDELAAAMGAPDGKADAVMAVAGKHGFEFTPEEFRDVVSEASASSEGKSELSEEELNQVAGGITSSLTSTSFSSPTLNLAYQVNTVLIPGGTFRGDGLGGGGGMTP